MKCRKQKTVEERGKRVRRPLTTSIQRGAFRGSGEERSIEVVDQGEVRGNEEDVTGAGMDNGSGLTGVVERYGTWTSDTTLERVLIFVSMNGIKETDPRLLCLRLRWHYSHTETGTKK